MKIIRWACCVVFLCGAGISAGQEPADRFEKVVTRLVQAVNAGDYNAVQQDFGKVMRDAFPPAKSTPFFRNLLAQNGKIEKLDPPRLVPPNQAVFPAHLRSAVLDIKVVLDNQDKIIGLWFLPHAPSIAAPERLLTAFRLPFEGQWSVFWGGETKELNQHRDIPNQAFAFDFVVIDDAGKTYKGDGRRNEEYFAFGQSVLAPADGTVTEVITGVRDNAPGSMNPYSALGNAVILSHRENEVSVLAHFQQGSIRVKVGDAIKRGQILGLCGNSGNSSEPHIHFHVQDTAVIQDGTGMRCSFDRVHLTRDGKSESKTNYFPVKGDLVGPE